ncbi:MAG TPA: hypothetical protein VK427_07305, partial [Kofleriaceae bacterium]|nr:hypothetical protein [Kofleriaceae bacterium]
GGAQHAIIAALRTVATAQPWDRALEVAASLPPPLQVEVGLLAAADHQLGEPHRTRVLALARSDPSFAGRLGEL